MAGGKLTPRQKMINLMYLVFIAMLALNMSKEVLSAFGLVNEKFESANSLAITANESILSSLETKAQDNPAQYKEANDKAKKVAEASNSLYNYLATLKTDLTKTVEKENGKLPYERMDNSSVLDESWFSGDGLSKKGTEVLSSIENYKKSIKSILGDNPKYQSVINAVDSKFNTADVKDKEGVKKSYLDYYFKHFPLIASISKLTSMQNDIKVIESEVYSSSLGNSAIAAASMKNYTAFVLIDKPVIFPGDPVTGKVVLGRYDKNTVPTSVIVNDKPLNLNEALENGQANFNIPSGGIGSHDITGRFIFMENGKPQPIEIEKTNYVVVSKPNSATISADKMNVVYRGVQNPITVSFAGIQSSDVSASAPGLRPAGKPGAYFLSPTSGSEVTINVTGKLPDGKPVSDKKVFRIKSIPGPTGAIGGEVGVVKGAKSRLEVSQISAKMLDFDFEVKLRVVGFSLKVMGQATVVVSGDRVNAQCKAALARATRGDQVIISDIKTKLEGSDILLPRTAPVIYEVQ
jgi:gliding motility-associated protein GldM